MMPGEATSLDPNESNETYSYMILNHMYEGLVYIDESGNLAPGAAESYEVTDQNTTFTFILRDNLKWSDGQAVTAYDYRNSWMRYISPNTKLQSASLISPYILNVKEYMAGEVSEDEVGIYVLDDRTLQIKTKSPTPFLPDILTHNIFFPVRFDAIEKDGESWSKNPEVATSNGPFVLTMYKAGEYVELSKNEYYWNAENTKLDTIRFSFRTNDNDIVKLYNDKELDGLFEISASALRQIPESELEPYSKILPSTAFITFNHSNDLMKNREFRKAISISIDRAGVINDILLGAGIPTKYLVPIIYQIGGEPFRDYTELDDGKHIEETKAIILNLKDNGIYEGRTITYHYMLNEFLLITNENEALLSLRAIEDEILNDYHIAPVYNRKGIAIVSQRVQGWYRSDIHFNFSKAWIDQ